MTSQPYKIRIVIFDIINKMPVLVPAANPWLDAWKQTFPWLSAVFHTAENCFFFFVRPRITNGYLGTMNFHYIRRCINTLVNDEKKILNEKVIKLLCNPRKGLHSLKLPFL